MGSQLAPQLAAQKAAAEQAAAQQTAEQQAAAEATRQAQLAEGARAAEIEEAFAQRDAQQRALADNQVRVADAPGEVFPAATNAGREAKPARAVRYDVIPKTPRMKA
jgi:hypothetical protein